MRYRADIDGLRALAVLPVLLFHAGFGLTGGFVGVDVFFVISGYLITSLLLAEADEGRFSVLGFYERRARRILPALFTMIAVTSVCAAVVMLPSDLAEYGSSVTATTLFVANIWFYSQQGYFNEAAELKPLLHTWSLGVEEQFYIVFPLILLVLVRVLSRHWVFVALAAAAGASFLAAWSVVDAAPEAAFYLPHLRAWELLAGSLLAMTGMGLERRLSGRPSWQVQTIAFLGLVLILWPVVAYDPDMRRVWGRFC